MLLYYGFNMACVTWCMTPWHQLLVDFLCVCTFAWYCYFGVLCSKSCLLVDKCNDTGCPWLYMLFVQEKISTINRGFFFSILLIIMKDDHTTSRSSTCFALFLSYFFETHLSWNAVFEVSITCHQYIFIGDCSSHH